MYLKQQPTGPQPLVKRVPVEPNRTSPGGMSPRYAIDRADWIWDADQPAHTPAFRSLKLVFNSNGSPLRFQVSADQFFWLYLDGHVITRGPDVSPPWHYGFSEYEVSCTAGEHTLEAFVWWIGDDAPEARMTTGIPGFCLAGIDEWADPISTGKGDWKIAVINGYGVEPDAPQAEILASGKNGIIDARQVFDAPPEWKTPVACQQALSPNIWGIRETDRIMEPSNLPAMPMEALNTGFIRAALDEKLGHQPLPEKALSHPKLDALQGVIQGGADFTVPANTQMTLIWDLENYLTGWPEMVVSGGRDALIRQVWSESFFMEEDFCTQTKGNRNKIVGKYLIEGLGDRFICDGGENRSFTPYWWRAGRYCLIEIETKDQPLVLHRIGLSKSGHPFDLIGDFSCDQDERVAPILKACFHTLEVSSWDSYQDCPYYEQLQYIGDTRLEILMTYVLNSNAALPYRAIELLDQSRAQWGGLPAARFPCRVPQLISPFSLIYIWCIRDLMMWRNEPKFVKRLAPGIRNTLDLMGSYRDFDGLLKQVPGWPWVDHVRPEQQSEEAWTQGVPASGRTGKSASINLTYLMALQAAADIEQYLGEDELAQRYSQLAEQTAHALRQQFFNAELGILQDDASGEYLSTQTQVYGILAGVLSSEEGSKALDLAVEKEWIPLSYVFRFYEFEALRKIGRAGEIVDRLGGWQEMIDQGSFTAWEALEPSRSDCHAWSSHPLFHLPCSVAGIRPDSAGFKSVHIEPQPGSLKQIKTTIAHPQGRIRLALEFDNKGCSGTVELPKGIDGTFVYGELKIALSDGKTKIQNPVPAPQI